MQGARAICVYLLGLISGCVSTDSYGGAAPPRGCEEEAGRYPCLRGGGAERRTPCQAVRKWGLNLKGRAPHPHQGAVQRKSDSACLGQIIGEVTVSQCHAFLGSADTGFGWEVGEGPCGDVFPGE